MIPATNHAWSSCSSERGGLSAIDTKRIIKSRRLPELPFQNSKHLNRKYNGDDGGNGYDWTPLPTTFFVAGWVPTADFSDGPRGSKVNSFCHLPWNQVNSWVQMGSNEERRWTTAACFKCLRIGKVVGCIATSFPFSPIVHLHVVCLSICCHLSWFIISLC